MTAAGPRPATPVRAACDAFRFDAGAIGILLQHGFTGCPASMRPVGEALAERGISSVGPRLPGHGTRWEDLANTTADDWVAESERALLELGERCDRVLVAGLSFGGALALHHAARHPDLVRGVVCVNAYVNDRRLLFAPLGRILLRTWAGVGNDVKKEGVDEYAYDRIPVSALAHVGRFLRKVEKELPQVRQPVLIFSSKEDHTVKPRNSQLIAAKVGSERKRLVRLTNSYHVATLDNDAPAIVEEVAAFAREVAATV